MRLFLVAGPGGVGASRATARWAQRLAADDVRVGVADLDPWFGAAAQLADEGVRVLVREDDPFVARTAALLDRLGLDARVAGESTGLPGADLIELLHRLHAAVGGSELDVLLVDAGSRALDLVSLADRLPWLTTHLLQAQRGWLATVRPLTATVLGRWPGAEGHETARRIRDTALGWSTTLRSAEAVVVGEETDPRTRRVRLGLQLHDLPVQDGVRDNGGLPDPVARPGAGLAEVDGGLEWRVRLPGLRSEDLRVGRSGDDLSVEVIGVRRVVSLPSALRRYRAAGARLRADELVVQFVPEERPA